MQAPEQETVQVLDGFVSIHHPVTVAPRSDIKCHPTIVTPRNDTDHLRVHRYAAQVLLTSAPLTAADLLALAGSTLLALAFSGLLWANFELDLTSCWHHCPELFAPFAPCLGCIRAPA